MLIDGDVGVSAQRRERAHRLLAGGGGLRLGLVGGVHRLVVLLARDDARVDELFVARRFTRGVVDGFVRGRNPRDLLAVGGLLRIDLKARGGELRLRILERGGERLGVELEQHLAGLDVLVLLHVDLDHTAADAGGNRGAVGLDVGVVEWTDSGRR